MKKYLLLVLIMLCGSLRATEIRLAWDASITPDVTYRLYAHTSSLTADNLSSALVKVNAGTNLTTIMNLKTGNWYLAFTAINSFGESDPVLIKMKRARVMQWVVY